MQTFRDSISNIPSALTNIIHNIPTSSILNANRHDNQSPQSSLSGDDSSDKSQAIPNSLIKEQWQLILGQDASIEHLETAVSRCKELVINTDECSYERKWLVRHLVELRFRLKEIQDVIDDPKIMGPNTLVILGHHFQNFKITPTSRQYCDHCSGIIWSVVQASYICADCQFCVHHKCVQNVIRICAHVITSERKDAIENICPEIGLAMQSYKCAECQTPLNFKGSWIEPRICDYSGLYYCPTCHWNDTSIIPARIIHNWDFSLRKISRASLQELNLIHQRPVIHLEYRNPKLFIYVQNLSLVQKLRDNLCYMRKYLSECRIATSEKFIDNQIGTKRHLIQSTQMYSIADLVSVETGTIVDYLNKIYQGFDKHIRNCDICTGKGYLCEICGNNEVIFPYDDGAIMCSICVNIFHRACWLRKNTKCPKCTRIEQRRLLMVDEENDDINES